MTGSDLIFEKVTRSGSPFEIGERDGMRQFVNAPSDLNQMIERTREFGDRAMIVEGDLRLSYAQVFARRDALAAALGIEKGDRVGLCMKNSASWMIGFLAILSRGGVAVAVNSRGAPTELADMLGDVGATIVLADPDRARRLRDGGFAGRIIEAHEFPSEAATALDPVSPAQPDDAAAILFTSGTTGRVKGAVLSHKNLIHGIMLMQLSGVMVLHGMAEKFGTDVETLRANLPQAAVLQVYPLFHISGLGSAFLSPTACRIENRGNEPLGSRRGIAIDRGGTGNNVHRRTDNVVGYLEQGASGKRRSVLSDQYRHRRAGFAGQPAGCDP